jgi:hypothetical protein
MIISHHRYYERHLRHAKFVQEQHLLRIAIIENAEVTMHLLLGRDGSSQIQEKKPENVPHHRFRPLFPRRRGGPNVGRHHPIYKEVIALLSHEKTSTHLSMPSSISSFPR